MILDEAAFDSARGQLMRERIDEQVKLLTPFIRFGVGSKVMILSPTEPRAHRTIGVVTKVNIYNHSIHYHVDNGVAPFPNYPKDRQLDWIFRGDQMETE